MAGFAGAPDGFRPTDVWKDCQSVLCFGIALPSALLEEKPDYLYGHFNELSAQMVDTVAFRLSCWMERELGYRALPLPCDTPYEAWKPETLEGRGILSVKHAAVAAGIGTLGKNTMLLHPRFGNRLTLGVVLCELPLPADPPAKPLCPPGCQRCLKACPTHALDGTSANQALCRPQAYGKDARGFDIVRCNRCRTVCPLRNGLKSGKSLTKEEAVIHEEDHV